MKPSLRGSLSLSGLQRRKLQARTHAGPGFSLIEILGVLAIMGILAGMLAPSVVRQIRQAQTTKEDSTLEEVARALIEGIQATGTFPNPDVAADAANGGWVTIARNYTSLNPTALQFVLPGNNPRKILFNTALEDYLQKSANDPTPGNGYETPETGWVDEDFPSDAVIYILSSSRPDLVLGGAITDADIAEWNKVADQNGLVTVPNSVFGAANNMRGEFFHVKRIAVRDLFCRVTLMDLAAPPRGITTRQGGTGQDYESTYVYGELAGYEFRFEPLPNGRINAGVYGTLVSGSRSLVSRENLPSPQDLEDREADPDPTPLAQFNLELPDPPRWQINYNNTYAVNVMPTDSNTQYFYVLKGAPFTLKQNSAPYRDVLKLKITADCSFEYYNSSWTRKD